MARVGAAAPGPPERSPSRLPTCRRGGGALLWFVQSSVSARWRLALHALETQQKEKGNQPRSTGSRRSADGIRAAPPFLVERVGGVEGGGAGEGSYLRFNCRWRLRLFQERKSSPKIKQTDQKKKKKKSKRAFNFERSALPTKDCKRVAARAGSRYRDKAQGLAGRPEVSTGSCCRRPLELQVVL